MFYFSSWRKPYQYSAKSKILVYNYYICLINTFLFKHILYFELIHPLDSLFLRQPCFQFHVICMHDCMSLYKI